jgi:CubicO group peptidase (beta-lactamase class C family)
MSSAQKVVHDVLAKRIADGTEVGLQVAAFHRGELIVDASAGVTSQGGSEPVTADTLFCLFSASKGVTSTAVHAAVDRGQISYDDPVCLHWPEFGSYGKSAITIRHVLAHTAGLPDTPLGVEPQSWELMCWAITLMEPQWEPGTATGYSGLTFGWILGEVLRRATGRTIGELVSELFAPLAITDLHFGVPPSALPRVATLSNDVSMTEGPYASYATRYFAPAFNRDEIRQASIPAGGVIGNAVSLARMYAALIGDGDRLLSTDRMRAATTLQTDEVDRTLGVARRKALGYLLGGPDSPMPDRMSAFGHSGHGGTFGFADPEHGFAFALTKNHLVQAADPRAAVAYEVAAALRAELGIPS